MKNLILVHLESLSEVIYKLNDECFPNLIAWSKQAENYVNYYSTATSTLMVLTDLAYGRMDCFEQASYLENIFDVECHDESLFTFLRKRGYFTKNIHIINSDQEIREKLQPYLAKNGEFWIGDSLDEAFKEIEKAVNVNESFAIMIEDNAGHVAYKGSRLNRDELSGTEWYKRRYQSIDSTVGRLRELLERNGLIDNTLVVMYGDHGDELYFHGVHEGYTHAVEPFVNMIKCPLIIFDGNVEYRKNDNLISTVDLCEMIKYKLGMTDKPLVQRKYAFSRNLYAAQRRMADVFNKSYAVTDGEYILIANSKGSSLYNNTMDPLCQMNLLKFFKMKKGELYFKDIYNMLGASHFRNFMVPRQKDEIVDRFNVLQEQLKNYLNNQKYLMGKIRFDRISTNKYSWDPIIFKHGKWKKVLKNIIKKCIRYKGGTQNVK